jgi:hypothetical protein
MVNYVDKIRVYINTVELSALDLVSVNTLGHQCNNPEARISAGMQHVPKGSSGLVSEERKTIELVEQFSEENGLKCEIIDLAKAGSMTRLKFMLKGWKTPTVSFENEAIVGLPTREQLESLVRRRHA